MFIILLLWNAGNEKVKFKHSLTTRMVWCCGFFQEQDQVYDTDLRGCLKKGDAMKEGGDRRAPTHAKISLKLAEHRQTAAGGVWQSLGEVFSMKMDTWVSTF